MNEKDDTRTLVNGMLCKIDYDDIVAACDDNYIMSLVGRDAEVVVQAVNQGIDSRLQACNSRDDFYEMRYGRLEIDINPESLCVLIRRLFDIACFADDCDNEDCLGSTGHLLAESILMTLGFDDGGQFVGREALGLD